MTIRTHYDNLKVSRTATKEEIKKAYRRLCSKHHPDKHPEAEREKQNRILVLINSAYQILSDDSLRRKHDEWIASQERSTHQQYYYNQNTNETRDRQFQEQQARERELREKQRREQQERDRQRQQRAAQEAQQKKMREEEEAKKIERRKKQQEEAHKRSIVKRRIMDCLVGAGAAALIIYGITTMNPSSKDNAESANRSVPQKRKFKSLDELKIDHYDSAREDDKVTVDIYFDNHADEFDKELVRDGLKGNLAKEPICLQQQFAPKKFEYIFHFLRGGKRVYLTLTLPYLCQRT